MHRIATLAVVVLVAIPVMGNSVEAQATGAVPTRMIGKPEVEYAEPFSMMTGLRELSDGRVVISDYREKLIRIIDLKGAKPPVTVGREGRGPGEWGLAGQLLVGRADTTWLLDLINRRLLAIGPTGATGTMVPLLAPGASPTELRSTMLSDRLGRFYAEGSAVLLPTGGLASGTIHMADSVPIIRSDATLQRPDTIAWLRLPKMSVEVNMSGARPQTRARGMSPFAARDAWSVGTDGSVVIARVADYHIERILPDGKRMVGSPIPYQRVPVTTALKEEAVAAMQKGMAQFAGEMPPGFNLNALIDGFEWPEFKPPFQGSISVAPDGRVWVPVAGRAGEGPAYDVIDTGGRLVERVSFPPRTALFAFSSTAMYVVRMDADDLQYLQRHKR
jgi:hypothetical protein